MIKKKKRILLTFNKGLSHGGVQSVIMSIVRGLKDEYIFDLLVSVSEKQYFDDEFLSYGGTIIRIPFYEGKNVFRRRCDYYIRGFYLYKKAVKVLNNYGPYDVIHCNDVYESGPIIKAAKISGIPIRIVHSHAIPCKEPLIRGLLNRLYLKQILYYSTNFLGCSNQACKSFFGSSEKCKIIFNSYDETKFMFQDNGNHDCKTITLVQVGRYDKVKNQQFSIEILKHIILKGHDAKLVLIGSDEGVQEFYLRKLANEYQLLSHIEFCKTNSDIQSYLAIADAFLFPSLAEGFGTALIEAQVVGTKCYVSDSVPKETNCGGCCYMSLSDGAEKWASVIISDYQKSNGRHKKYNCDIFKPNVILEKYKKIYEEIIHESRNDYVS